MKLRPVGAEILHADGRTDMTKIIVAFRYFANAPKKSHPSTDLERPREFEELETPGFQDSRHMQVVMSAALSTGGLANKVTTGI